jgi:hypothetical protein
MWLVNRVLFVLFVCRVHVFRVCAAEMGLVRLLDYRLGNFVSRFLCMSTTRVSSSQCCISLDLFDFILSIVLLGFANTPGRTETSNTSFRVIGCIVTW